MTVGRKQQETDEKRGEREWKKEQAKGEKELAFFSFNTYPLISSPLHSANFPCFKRLCECVCVCACVCAPEFGSESKSRAAVQGHQLQQVVRDLTA